MPLILRIPFNALLLTALGLFLAGIYSPLMELEKFWFFRNEFSLASSLSMLWYQNEQGLFWLIFLFSIVTPLLKLAVLAIIANTSNAYQVRHQRWIHFLEVWGKWSMLDVFVVALMVVSIKLGPLANVTLHIGLYYFAGAVLLVQLLTVFVYFWLKNK